MFSVRILNSDDDESDSVYNLIFRFVYNDDFHLMKRGSNFTWEWYIRVLMILLFHVYRRFRIQISGMQISFCADICVCMCKCTFVFESSSLQLGYVKVTEKTQFL